MSEIRLYSYWRSSASWRVRIALAHKELAYDYTPVHLVADGGHQHSDAYRALNPMREVPTLIVDGAVLTQSLPIIEYLEERWPEKPLLPSDLLTRAHARRLAEIVNSDIQPVQNLRVLQKLDADFGVGGSIKAIWAAHWIALGFEGLEPLIKESAGSCCIGDDVTIADVCLVPQVYNARRFNVDMSRFPTIDRIERRLSGLPAFIAAHPDQQPDAVPT